jgi:hypothetical protein
MLDRKRFYFALAAGLIAGAALLSGCELSQNIPLPQASPTQNNEQVQTPTVAPSLTLEASLTATMAVTSAPQVESPTPAPPTETPTITPTFNPYATYIVREDDTMYYILQQPPFNYESDSWNAIIEQILELNPFIRSADRLPGPGSSITIPLPSQTSTPEGFTLTQAAQPNVTQQQDPLASAQIIQVAVEEGQTIIGIAQRNSTTLPIIATLNPQLTFENCDFSTPSGGSGCTVFFNPGDLINVPALTPTPTLSPTISGSETPTPTPTFRAPALISPPEAANAPARAFSLQWVSAGVLNQGEVYLVEIEDQTAGTSRADVTTGTSYDLPEELVPTDGQPHMMRWRVSVASQNEQGIYRYIGATGDWRTFRWQSR